MLLISLGLRLAWLDRLPWGLHADEVAPSLTALEALHGRLAFALPDYDIWLHAASFWMLGVSPVAVRLLPALVGSFFPLSVYLAFRHLFGRRVALLASMLAATAIWPLVLSRSGFSISYLPVVLCLLVWQLQAGWQTGRARNWLAGGFLLAAAQYVYFPARALIPVLVLSAVYLLLFGPRQRWRDAWPLLAAFVPAVAPLYWRTVQLDAETTRYSTVFILAPQNNPGSPMATLARQAWLALSMFSYQGDQNFRHNVPVQPVFNPLVAVLALVGLGILLREWRRPRNLFWFLWMGCLLTPMVLSIESPHFLRAAGILPLCFVLPALGLDRVMREAEQRGWRRWGIAVIVVTLAFSLGYALNAYFGTAYARSSELYYAFEGENMDLAVQINRFLDVGWQGAGALATSRTPQPGRQVWIDQSLLSDPGRQRTLRLLVPLEMSATPAWRSFSTAGEVFGEPAPGATEMELIVVQGQEQPAVTLLPRNRLIHVTDGPPRPPWTPVPWQPYRTYATESPAGLNAHPLACFAEGIELLTLTTKVEAVGVKVDLIWRATARPAFDYTVFTHIVLHDTVVGQVDAYPAAGGYLTSWWRPGDVVDDERTVPVPPQTDLAGANVRLGIYRWDTLAHLGATDCAGKAMGDFVLFPMTGVR